MAFVIGDVVQLKSGGLSFTVTSPADTNGNVVVCSANGGSLLEARYAPALLQTITAALPNIGQIASLPEFQQRVGYWLMSAAVAVYAEAGTTPGHAARTAYAIKVANGQANLQSAALAVLTNATIAAEAVKTNAAGNGIPDGDIQFAVNSLWNLLAGA